MKKLVIALILSLSVLSFLIVINIFSQVIISSFVVLDNPSSDSISLSLEIPEKLKSISPGDKIPIVAHIENRAYQGRFDITLFFSLIDSSGNKFTESSKTVAVETTSSFFEEIEIPKTLESGVYTIELISSYNNKTAKASKPIIINKKQNLLNLAIYGFMGLTTILTLGIVIEYFKIIKLENKVKND